MGGNSGTITAGTWPGWSSDNVVWATHPPSSTAGVPNNTVWYSADGGGVGYANGSSITNGTSVAKAFTYWQKSL